MPEIDQPPSHVVGCNGIKPCAGCVWLREFEEDAAAWNRWTGLFWIPWGDGTGWS